MEIAARLESRLNPTHSKIQAWDNGCLFYDHPFRDDQPACMVSDELTLLSEDILVTASSEGEYRRLSLGRELSDLFLKKGTDAFNAIHSDFCMAVLWRRGADKGLYLASNRAGSGRIYYHTLDSGILFSSDLRFLLSLIPLEVSPIGVYALLKYGAIPEPLTIGEGISAVPPAHYLKYDLSTGEHAARPFFKFHFDFERDSQSPPHGEVNLEPVKNALVKSARFLDEYQPAMLLSGGIDSSLYGCYLHHASKRRLQAFYCAFGQEDPEFPYAQAIAERIGTTLQVAMMDTPDAMNILDEVVRLTDHPFADFSSMPTAFVLKYVKERLTGQNVVIECNGGDDCFGFPALQHETKYLMKHRLPRLLKRAAATWFQRSSYWKWEAREGMLARVAAAADAHELTPLNYFLIVTPMNYINPEIAGDWDAKIQGVMEGVFSSCGGGYARLGYKARTTIRQLLHINSRRWAAKALSVGQSLGLRVIYPYIWQDVLVEQGRLPWNAKVRNGVVKWPLKKLLEEFMPQSFVYRKKSGFVPPFARWLTDRDFNNRLRDILLNREGFVTRIVPARVFEELLLDASKGRKLRFPVLELLWGAAFTEAWIQKHK
jgi:asparagine synthase (glutamine-hydrolysing)